MFLRHYLLLPSFVLLLLASSCETDLSTGNEITEGEAAAAIPAASTPASGTQALEALDLVNAIRATGCTCGNEAMPPAAPLDLHPELQLAAEHHSADQANRQRMGHQGSDGSRVGDRLDAAGYSWRSVGENVAWNQRSVAQVVNAWKGSPGHCRNLMNPDYLYMGFAVQDWYWTQVLAR